MFYSHDILTRRGGRFYVLWFSATKATKLTRRDYTSVDVARMCEEIVNYLPTKRTGPDAVRMKFSLYLSSQLMYGLVLVYRKQQEYLLMDLRRAHELLQTAPTLFATIDLLRTASPRLDLADGLRYATEKSFGEGNFGRLMFSPVKDSSVLSGNGNGNGEDEVFSTHTSSLLESLDSELSMAPHTAHPSKITLKEDLAQIVRDFQLMDEDLLPPYEGFYDETFKMAQEFNVPFQTDEEEEQQVRISGSPTIDGVSSIVDKTPFVMDDDTSSVVRRKASVPIVVKASRPLTPEITMLHVEAPQHQQQQMDIGPDPERELERFRFRLSPLANETIDRERTMRNVRPKAKRVKIDEHVCLSSDEIRKQLDDYQDLIVPTAQQVVDKDRAYFAGKEEWWKFPCLDIPSSRITSIFQRNSTVKKIEVIDVNKVWNSPPWTIPVEHYRTSPESAQEFINNFNQVEEQSHVTTSTTVERQRDESTGIETSRENISNVPRDSAVKSISGLGVSQEDLFFQHPDITLGQQEIGVGLLLGVESVHPMEDEFALPAENQAHVVEGEREVDQGEQPKAKRRRMRSPSTKDQTMDCFRPVDDAPNSDRRTFGLRREQLLNELKEKTAGGRVVSFQSIVPLDKSRAQAGKTFYMLLDLLGKQKVAVEQSRPYGTISIYGKSGGSRV